VDRVELYVELFGVPGFLEAFERFLANEWARYAWAVFLTVVEHQYMQGLAGSIYTPMDLDSLPGRAFKEYRYVSPRGYTATLTPTIDPIHSTKHSILRVFGPAWEYIDKDLSTARGLAEAGVDLYRSGLGAEPLENLSKVAASKGVPEVARALEAAAELYRASEPYIAAELASGPGEPPEEFKEHLVSEVLRVVERAAEHLARGSYEEWEKELQKRISKRISLPLPRQPGEFEKLNIDRISDVARAVYYFENEEWLKRDLATAVEDYQKVRAAKAVLRVALAMGLIE